jgi:hypothetical protein
MLLTQKSIGEIQKLWGDGIVAIGKTHKIGGDYRSVAENFVANLYDYKGGAVLFKPTKASAVPFRRTEEEAISYFVGGVVAEDKGFALYDWKEVIFGEDYEFTLGANEAFAMGHYFFVAPDGEKTKTEYSFGYRLNKEGRLAIFLHHSSFPFNNK